MVETGKKSLTVAKALLRKRTPKKEYDTVPTGITDTTIRLEQGTRSNIPPTVLGSAVVNAVAYYEGQQLLDKLNEAQEGYSSALKGMATEHGLRGVFLPASRIMLAIFPQNKITWNIPRLRKALGINAPAVIQETISVTATLPLGHPTKEGPLTAERARRAVILGLKAIEFTEAELEDVVKAKVDTTVEEKTLNQLVVDKRVPDIEQTAEVTETMVIRPEPYTMLSAT